MGWDKRTEHDRTTYWCPLCKQKHRIASKKGQEHLQQINSEKNSKILAFNNLVDLKKILDYLKIEFWLDGGTLLGAYRDKDFCDDDENDVDLCTMAHEKIKIPELKRMAESAGFKIYHHWDYKDFGHEVAFTRDGMKIDLFFNEKDQENYWALLYQGDEHIPVVIPHKFYNELVDMEFRGAVFKRPKYIEEYLEYKYGDWRTPVHRSDYSCYDNTKNQVVRPDYDIRV